MRKLYKLYNVYSLKVHHLYMTTNKTKYNEKNINTWNTTGNICSLQL